MEFTIKTPWQEEAYKLRDLRPEERNALVGLLGLRSEKSELFNALRELPVFKKLNKQDLRQVCPQSSGFHLSIRQYLRGAVPLECAEAVAEIQELMPEARLGLRQTTATSDWCRRCQKVHSISKWSLKVSLEHCGVWYSKVLELIV